jgi:DNA-directed RNA polymerase alpha subunit
LAPCNVCKAIALLRQNGVGDARIKELAQLLEIPPTTEGSESTQIPQEILDAKVEDHLEVGVRCSNGLKNAKIDTIRDLVVKTEGEIYSIPSFGRRSLHEIKTALEAYHPGLKLGMTL